MVLQICVCAAAVTFDKQESKAEEPLQSEVAGWCRLHRIFPIAHGFGRWSGRKLLTR